MLANDIIGFHTHAYCINFLRCCDELLEADVDYVNGEVRHAGGRTLARAYPLSIDAERLQRAAESPEVAEAEREVLERRRKHLIIRVDRADLSKNVLRGFTAFDTFLTQHPEFREEVTFIAHLQPSRQDVPEYAEYLERIEALVAVVNHRHGTTDWMPIDLKIYENFPDAVARYKHFDLLMVNSIFDGMNLVAKEAPAVNTRDGVLMLSENTGSHEELCRLRPLGQPLRHPGAGRHDLPGADDGPAEERRRGPRGSRRSSTRAIPAIGSTTSWRTSSNCGGSWRRGRGWTRSGSSTARFGSWGQKPPGSGLGLGWPGFEFAGRRLAKGWRSPWPGCWRCRCCRRLLKPRRRRLWRPTWGCLGSRSKRSRLHARLPGRRGTHASGPGASSHAAAT